MKPEDEIFLSAYLDGALDPDERSSVESALLSDPALGERLRQLAAVRDLVASLPRPRAREDLSAAVLARVRRGRATGVGARLAAVPRSMAALAAAAMIVLSVTSGLHLGVRHRQAHHPALAPVVRAQVRPVQAGQPQAAPPNTPPVASRSTVTPGPRTVAARAADVPRVDQADLRRDRDQSTVRELLDSPNLRRILIVVDEIGGTARDRVESLVRRTPRIDPGFGRIVVAQGVSPDPKYPNNATVFALVVDDEEFRRFKGDLTHEFADSVEEVAAEPSVVTQLSGIGDVALLPGTPATDLHAPPAGQQTPLTALRTSPRSKTEVVVPDPDEFPGMPINVTGPLVSPVGNSADAHTDPERELSRPPAGSAGGTPAPGALASIPPADARSRNALRPRDSSIVLVWVTTRDRDRSGRR